MTYDAENFTHEKVVQAMRDAVAAKPERYTYPRQIREMPEGGDPNRPYYPNTPEAPWGTTCYYVHKGEEQDVAGCIVGTVLHSLGVPLEEFRAAEGKNVNGLREILHLPLESRSWSALAEAQTTQDSGQTWADALKYALNE